MRGNRMVKLSLDSKKIYDKTFSGNKPGYDPLQVDQFLDVIIKDYQEMEKFMSTFSKDYETLTLENSKLSAEVSRLQVENERLLQRLKELENNETACLNNIDYLKQINKLENALYKLGVNPNSIE